MTHTHSSESGPQSPEASARQRKALRIMVVVLIPIAVWTLFGLIVMWPGNISEHIRSDASSYTVEGVTTPEGQVAKVDETSCDGLEGSTPGADDVCANLQVKLLEGPEVDKVVAVQVNSAVYRSGVDVGQKVKLLRVPIPESEPGYQFSDFSRGGAMLFFLVLFVVAVTLVARLRGLISVLGLGFAAFIMVKFMFPALIAGSNPILVGLVGSSAIMFVVLYAAHGFSARTTTALLGTLFGLGLASILGYAASSWGHLTGVSSEDSFLLGNVAPDLQLTSVVICGIIVASLGALNDVTITQASAVWELAENDHSASRIYRRAMRIGRDHIASTVYTIAFATAGATLGTVLLISIYDRPLLEVVQQEQFAEEVIRTLVASIGLIMAMPLTTAIAAAVVSASRHSSEIRLNPGGGNVNTGDDLVDIDPDTKRAQRRGRPRATTPSLQAQVRTGKIEPDTTGEPNPKPSTPTDRGDDSLYKPQD